MVNRARIFLAVYPAVMFATMPFLPAIVIAIRDRIGTGAFEAALRILVVICVLLPTLNLFRPPRPRAPLPHLAYAGLLVAAAGAVRFLVSSPVAQVHLAEYALLAILVLLSLPPPRRGSHYLTALVLASAVGLVDEVVQHFVPMRFFDWWDVALNAAAAALGVLAALWWAWVAGLRREGAEEGVSEKGGARGSP